MDTFEYLAVFVSIIVGLAVAHLLQAIGRVISDPGSAKLYWVHTVWVVQTLSFLIYFWWFELGFRAVEEWTAPLYVFVVGYSVLLYLLCIVLVPSAPQSDYREYYFVRRRSIFGFFLALTLVDFLDTLLKPGGLEGVPWLEALMIVGVFAGLFSLAMYTKSPRYHATLAILWLANTTASFWFSPAAAL